MTLRSLLESTGTVVRKLGTDITMTEISLYSDKTLDREVAIEVNCCKRIPARIYFLDPPEYSNMVYYEVGQFFIDRR